MIKTVICYNVPGFVVVFYNRVVSRGVFFMFVLITRFHFIFYSTIKGIYVCC